MKAVHTQSPTQTSTKFWALPVISGGWNWELLEDLCWSPEETGTGEWPIDLILEVCRSAYCLFMVWIFFYDSYIIFYIIMAAAKYFYCHKHLLKPIGLSIFIKDYPALLGSLLLTQINFLVWISNHTPNKVWDKIIHPFPNFNGCTVKVWEWISNVIPQFIKDYLSLLGFKLIHVSKRGPWRYIIFQSADIYYVS